MQVRPDIHTHHHHSCHQRDATMASWQNKHPGCLKVLKIPLVVMPVVFNGLPPFPRFVVEDPGLFIGQGLAKEIWFSRLRKHATISADKCTCHLTIAPKDPWDRYICLHVRWIYQSHGPMGTIVIHSWTRCRYLFGRGEGWSFRAGGWGWWFFKHFFTFNPNLGGRWTHFDYIICIISTY